MNLFREPTHLLVLVIALIVIFGATRLPVIAKSVGQSMKILKSEVKDLREDGADDSTTASGAAPEA